MNNIIVQIVAISCCIFTVFTLFKYAYGKFRKGEDLQLSKPPVKDTEDAWFGHGGAWGTNCMVNWHKKQLRLWVIQSAGGPQPWLADLDKAAQKFFSHQFNRSGVSEYTGRIGDN